MHTLFWWGKLRERDQLEDTGIHAKIWEDNIKMGLQEVGWRGMDWVYLTQDKDKWRHL